MFDPESGSARASRVTGRVLTDWLEPGHGRTASLPAVQQILANLPGSEVTRLASWTG